MFLDKKMKKKIFVTMGIALIGQIIAVLPLFRSSIISSQLWHTSLGAVVIINDFALFFVMQMFSFGKENRLLRYSLIANPGVAGFLAGIGLIVSDNSAFIWLNIIVGFGVVVSILVGFVLMTRHLIVKGKQNNVG